VKPIVSYVRVSTSQQGRSGLGIEAQREALSRFAASEDFEIVAEFVEVETGKGSDALNRRPELAAALAKARALRSPVAVAKLAPRRRRKPSVTATFGHSASLAAFHSPSFMTTPRALFQRRLAFEVNVLVI
jgi:DNA invertase Pin-like site-specific DNA recombinase